MEGDSSECIFNVVLTLESCHCFAIFKSKLNQTEKAASPKIENKKDLNVYNIGNITKNKDLFQLTFNIGICPLFSESHSKN